MKLYRLVIDENEKEHIQDGKYPVDKTTLIGRPDQLPKFDPHMRIDEHIFPEFEKEYPNAFFFSQIEDCIGFNRHARHFDGYDHDNQPMTLTLDLPAKTVFNYCTAGKYPEENSDSWDNHPFLLEAFVPVDLIKRQISKNKHQALSFGKLQELQIKRDNRTEYQKILERLYGTVANEAYYRWEDMTRVIDKYVQRLDNNFANPEDDQIIKTDTSNMDKNQITDFNYKRFHEFKKKCFFKAFDNVEADLTV